MLHKPLDSGLGSPPLHILPPAYPRPSPSPSLSNGQGRVFPPRVHSLCSHAQARAQEGEFSAHQGSNVILEVVLAVRVDALLNEHEGEGESCLDRVPLRST